MAKLPDPILEFFVDREAERTIYDEMVKSARFTRIFCVKAEDKGGKSWLLKRLRLESKQAGWPSAYIDLSSADAENAEEMLLSIASQMSGTVQQELEQALGQIHQHTPQTDVKSAGALTVDGDIVGGNKVTVNTFGSEKHVTVEVIDRHGYQQRVNALTRAFKRAMAALPADICPMLFLDQFESVNTDYVLPWLQRELFEPLRSGDIEKPLLVIAGKENFVIFRDTEWEFAVFCHDLPGLPEDAIRQYWLERRKLPEQFLPMVLEAMARENGLPGKLTDLVWMFEQSRQAGNNPAGQSPAGQSQNQQVSPSKDASVPPGTPVSGGTLMPRSLKGAETNV